MPLPELFRSATLPSISRATSASPIWRTSERDLRSIGFEAIEIQVHIDADVLKAFLDQAVLWSLVANTLHNPVPLDLVLAWERGTPSYGLIGMTPYPGRP